MPSVSFCRIEQSHHVAGELSLATVTLENAMTSPALYPTIGAANPLNALAATVCGVCVASSVTCWPITNSPVVSPN